MDLKQISYVITIAQMGNMTKAAENIHVSQSALSQSCHNLERELGLSLFQKEGRSLKLTEDGVLFCEKGAELLAQAEQLRNLMEQQKHKNGHTLNYYTDVVDNCDETILQYQTFFPDICFERQYCTQEQAVLRLRSRSLDFALTLQEMKGTKLQSECLIDEPVVILVSRQSRFAGQSSVWLKQLEGETLAIYQNAENLKALFLYFLAQAGVQPGKILQLYDPFFQIQKNHGFLFMPESTWNCFHARGRLPDCEGIRVRDEVCRRRVFLTSERGREHHICQAFFSYLRDYHRLSKEERCLPDLDRFVVCGSYELAGYR